MPLLQDIVGGLMGGAGGGGASPMAGVLMGLLGGGQGAQVGGGQVGGGQTGGMMGGGGLSGLLSGFERAGLGSVAQSWVGSGPNQPVSPQQLQSVFGEQQVQSMASQAGMQPQDFLSQMSQHLPNAVDQMTPGGRVPDEGSVSV